MFQFLFLQKLETRIKFTKEYKVDVVNQSRLMDYANRREKKHLPVFERK